MITWPCVLASRRGRDDATQSRKSVKKRNGDEKRRKKNEKKKNQKKTGEVGGEVP